MPIEQKIQRDVPLKDHTTFKIGGPAKYFLEAKTEDVVGAVDWAKQNNLPFFVLGGGSNILVSDKGYDGLVISVQDSAYKVVGESIKAGAGLKLADLIEKTAEQGLSGLEWAKGIPNITLGGAIFNNAGAFDNSIADIIEKVEVFDTTNSQIKQLSQTECLFGYKQTIFKQNHNLIILSACLKLKKTSPAEVQKKIAEVKSYRQERHPMEHASAGCIFINPPGQRAADLIEQCGLKGRKIGQAQISEKHANFIVNLGNSQAKDVLALIDLAKELVKNNFKIDLKQEIQYLGDLCS